MENNKNNHKEEKKHQEEKPEKNGPCKDGTVTLPESEYLAIKEAADKSQEYWQRLLRLQADFENMRKRMEREKQEFVKYANEGVLLGLLNILDDLERTIELAQTNHQDVAVFLKGVEMILAHLYEMLKEYGVKPIDAKGKKFDPNYHEALMQVTDASLPEHTIIEELQKGYCLNDKVMRTSKVKVSKLE